MMRGQNHFVSCVCMMPADEEFPEGLVITGSTDHTIQAFSLTSTQPVFSLAGHSDNGRMDSSHTCHFQTGNTSFPFLPHHIEGKISNFFYNLKPIIFVIQLNCIFVAN